LTQRNNRAIREGGFEAIDFRRVVEHLLGLANVNVEEWPGVAQALVLQVERIIITYLGYTVHYLLW